MTSRPPWTILAVSHVVTMLSYANSMLNPLLYAAFNENLRVGFAHACRCLTGGGGRTGTTARGDGQSMTGCNTTDYRLRRSRGPPVAREQVELVEVVAVSGQTAALIDEVTATRPPEDVDDSNCDAVVAEPSTTPVPLVAINKTGHL